MDTTQFEDRVSEIEDYLKLLKAIEIAAQAGLPEIGNSVMTTCQQRILYSSVYLHLYNLVEATANWCVSAVSDATAFENSWSIGQLEPSVRREWVRTSFRTHTQLHPDNRLDSSFDVCEEILKNAPIKNWRIGHGDGSWDDKAIEKVSGRVGCVLDIPQTTNSDAKRPFRDDLNALEYFKELRNKLAHGSISFEQSGENITVGELSKLKDCTVDYLREVMRSFKSYVDSFMYLTPASRPQLGDNS